MSGFCRLYFYGAGSPFNHLLANCPSCLVDELIFIPENFLGELVYNDAELGIRRVVASAPPPAVVSAYREWLLEPLALGSAQQKAVAFFRALIGLAADGSLDPETADRPDTTAAERIARDIDG
jgi:hypothetical protein